MGETEIKSPLSSLNYIHQGQGFPCLLVHGFAASNQDWIYLQPQLTDNGFQVFAPDLIGHGSSHVSLSKPFYTFDHLYQHFENWVDSLQVDQKISLVGHSMGGLITISYALQHTGAVEKIVLINPYYDRNQLNPILSYLSKNPDPYQKVLEVAPAWLIHFFVSLDVRGWLHYEDRTRRQKAEDITRAAPEIVYIPKSIPMIKDQLTDFSIPTCVIWGTRDTTLNPGSFSALVEMLPDAISVPIQGAGHQPHLAQPELVNQQVIDFLIAR